MKLSRAAAVLLATVSTVLITATSAMAQTSTPSGWPSGPSLSTLQVLGLFVGIPVALFVVLFGLGAFLAGKSRNYVPPSPEDAHEIHAGGDDPAAIAAH